MECGFTSAYGQYFAGLLGANIASASKNMTNLEKLNTYADGYQQLAILCINPLGYFNYQFHH